MTSSHSTFAKPPCKPAKPHQDFPLFPHARGKWAKKIRGKMHYFGHWDDPQGALAEYLDVKDDLLAGRTPSRIPGEFTVRDAVNHFLTAKQRLVESGELSSRTFSDYRQTAEKVVDHFGKNVSVSALTPEDFNRYRANLTKTRGHVSVGNEVQRVRTLFKWCYDAEFIDRPVRFGPEFKKPSRRVVRKEAQAKGKKLLTQQEIHALLDEVGIHLRAMAFLGINCGFGNSDCGNLTLDAIDLAGGWIDFPRPKTAVMRRCPLWTETVKALRASLDRRPEPIVQEAERLAFVTMEGFSWSKWDNTNPISKRTSSSFRRLKIHRPGMSFYWLRHTFATIAAQTCDQVAVNFIMGHSDDTMPANYRHEIDDDRLLAIVSHVHAWLYSPNRPSSRTR